MRDKYPAWGIMWVVQPDEVTGSRWGCARSARWNPPYPRHVIDQDRYARTGELVALCGEQVFYIDGHTAVTESEPYAGADIVSAHSRECRRCVRAEQFGSDVVLVPTDVLRQLAAGVQWQQVEGELDAQVLALVYMS